MPTRKQRKRALKERRHEYETVWVDGDGNELEEAPDQAPTRESRSDGKSKPQQKRPAQQRGNRPTKTPLPPSWARAAKRSLIMGAVVAVFMYLVNSKASPGARALSALGLGVFYAALFIPFTYYLDRFGYTRYQRKNGQLPPKPAKR